MEIPAVVLRAINSSSKFKQRWLCPGSAHAEKRMGAQSKEETEIQKEGVLLHWKDAHPEESRDELKLDQIETLNKNKRLRDAFLMDLTKLGVPNNARRIELVEREFFLNDHEGIPIESHGEPVPGHPDIVIYFPEYRTAVIFDSKFGRKEVPAAWINLQLRSYAVMMFDNYECDKIVVGITQPWGKAGNDFHCAEYDAVEIPEFRQELINILKATEPEDAPLKPSPDACTYCLALGDCPAAFKVTTDVAMTNIDVLSPAELEDLAEDIELAEKVTKRWKERMKEIASEHPELLTKFRMGKPGSNRNITNIAAAFRELLSVDLIDRASGESSLQYLDFILESDNQPEVLGLLEAFLLSVCSGSAAQMEEMIGRSKGLGKDAAKSRLTTALGDIIETTPKAASLERIPISLHVEK